MIVIALNLLIIIMTLTLIKLAILCLALINMIRLKPHIARQSISYAPPLSHYAINSSTTLVLIIRVL